MTADTRVQDADLQRIEAAVARFIEQAKAKIDACLTLCEQECRHPLCDFHAWLCKQPEPITYDFRRLWLNQRGGRCSQDCMGDCGSCEDAARGACAMCGDTALHDGDECSLVERFEREVDGEEGA